MSDFDDFATKALQSHFAELSEDAAKLEIPAPPPWFDEEVYFRLNPDVAVAVAQGKIQNAYHHYYMSGWREKRALFRPGEGPTDQLLRIIPRGIDKDTGDGLFSTTPICNVEAFFCSPKGGVFVVGWMDDVASPLKALQVNGEGWSYTFASENVCRFRRRDVETSLGTNASCSHGFFAFAFLGEELAFSSEPQIEFCLRDESCVSVASLLRKVDEVELRNLVMTYLSQSEYLGSQQVEAINRLDRRLGHQIISQNQYITTKVKRGVHVEYFGQPHKPVKGSLVVCLYGRAEYFFLQHALFSGLPGFDDYELIYVSNSPELAERLVSEARAAQIVYGVPVVLVLLPGNAGFGAANNVAVSFARSNRVLIINPDVFPHQSDWAAKHTAAVEQLPPEQQKIFGAPLYYDDGSLMHGGMYLELDTGISVRDGWVESRKLARVEHYGKGAPNRAIEFLRPRPVPAVTGAFISVERAWFEKLGGFTEDFVFGHYEDADLCLKSLSEGQPAWIHDIRMWHLEGKGSTRLPVHEGGSLVNRWLFTERWKSAIENGLEGPSPTHPMLKFDQ